MKVFKYSAIFLIVILLFSVLTNPTLKDFEEFLPDSNNKEIFTTRSRMNNYFIFSIYHVKISEVRYIDFEKEIIDVKEYTYFGFFKNFRLRSVTYL
jgi:hypothetical protein